MKPQPANFSTEYAPDKVTTGEGATSMGFYNVLQGDAAYTEFLADHYAFSDNYHQPAMGGTGLDSIILFLGDARRSRSRRSLTCRGSNAKSCEAWAAAKAALFVAAGKGLFQSSSNRFRSVARK